MRRRFVSCIILMSAIFSSIFLFGCTNNNKIQFYRESKASALMNKFAPQQKAKPAVRSGIIILRDETDNSTINFGPRDINFDLPVKFK